ncbi:MAG: TIR domain-containing protein [Planctomycetaceae bacterium]|nr:TIR domain-containing protein [Planctomycetaceae bacterium]
MPETPATGSVTPVLKRACIIQAVAADARQRADRVLQSIIKPACQATGYETVRLHDLDQKTIVEPIVSALNTHPLAIADLAAPPWDPNVLMEVGFRLAYGRPIVFLADTDPKPDLLPLQLRNVHINTIDSANPGQADVESLIQSIKRYGPEVNYWASDYPTIEFSISFRSPDGGRFIFANDKAAKLYGLGGPEELIGRPVNEIDPRLKNFVPDEEYYKEYERDQDAILGKIMTRDPDPKMASIPLWFTKHDIETEIDNIYWPVLVQYRYVSDEERADIVMRVIFINVKEWDAMKPRPRTPPQVLYVPKLFQEVRKPIPPQHHIFLSYNSKDVRYVSKLFQMLDRCGLEVWFDQKEFSGAIGLTDELIRASNLSRIFVLVLGKNGLGPWQTIEVLRIQLLKILRGEKPFVLLLLPEVEPGTLPGGPTLLIPSSRRSSKTVYG